MTNIPIMRGTLLPSILIPNSNNTTTTTIWISRGVVQPLLWGGERSATLRWALSKHNTSIFDSDNCSDDDLSRDEIAEYLGEKVLTRNSDVLTYWKSKEVQWPRLAKMAKDFLAPTATSASSERVFSSGRDLLGITRYRLLPETMEAAICLRSGLLSLLSCE